MGEAVGTEEAVRTSCEGVPRRLEASGVEAKREGGGGDATPIERFPSIVDLP